MRSLLLIAGGLVVIGFLSRRAAARTGNAPPLPPPAPPNRPAPQPTRPVLAAAAPVRRYKGWNKPELSGKRILTEFPLADPARLVKTQAPDSAARPRLVMDDAAAAYLDMVAAARAAGVPGSPILDINSGYRSDAEQQVIWDRRLKMEREKGAKLGLTEAQIIRKARKWVAPPLSSNHRTGRTIDLNLGYTYGESNLEKMRNTAAWKWLNDNAEKFGFYPYDVEPWHWEYNPPTIDVV